ncbi:MAG: S9 family peptidase [Acidobacteriota bacterium]
MQTREPATRRRPSSSTSFKGGRALVGALILTACGAVVSTPALADGRGFTAHDLVTMARLSDPQPSPDGRSVVYVLRETDLEADRGRTDLWHVPADGSAAPRRLTSHPSGDSHPRWAPDGSAVFFLSSRSGSSQVGRLPMGAGEAQQVTRLPLDVGGFAVSPKGDRLAVSLEVFPDCDDLACTVDRLAAKDGEKHSGMVYDRLFVRHWDTWKDGRRSHLFALPLNRAGVGGEPVDVTAGLDADVPSKPFGGFEEITFTPDGEGLVFTARVAGAEEPWSTNFDLYHAPADGSKPPRRLTDNPAWDTQPTFSPDGGTLAYLAMERPGFEADRYRVVLRSWPDGEDRVLTQGWDRSSGGVQFSADGKTLFTTAGDRGQVRLFAIDVASGKVRELWGEGHVRSPGQVAGDRLVFGLDTLVAPVDLFTLPIAGGETPKRLTEVNAERLEGIAMGGYEQFTFPGWNNETVYGFMVEPANFDSAKRYPVAFLIHGGPQGSFDNDFHYRWNPQVYAGAGYAVVMIDFHGSTGYGQAFTDSITGDWGGKPLEDLQKGWAHAQERYSFLDGDRSCALGASYGGYMINWIAGRWGDTFDCLVNHDGLFNLESMYYSTEELWFPEWEMGGKPWQKPESFNRHNPMRFVQNWKTPMLVIHGALDYRVVDTEGLATFTALQRQGVPSKLLYFPDENHWVLKPANSVQWHDEVLAWLSRWTREPAED